MMKKIKNILIFVLIFAAAVVAYLFLRKPETAPLTTVPTAPVTGGAPQSTIGQEFLTILLSLKDIRLDGSIFKNAQFQNLRDFSTPITRVPGEEGRPNPFAALEAQTAQAAVETVEATVITSASATLNGLVDLALAAAPKFFAWGATPDLENKTEVATEATATGFFSKTLADLTPGTTYFFQANVIAGREMIKGEVFSFITLPQ